MRIEIYSTLKICVTCDSDQMATLLQSSFKNSSGFCHKSAFFSFDLQSSTAGNGLNGFFLYF